jgi:hypothetical protein
MSKTFFFKLRREKTVFLSFFLHEEPNKLCIKRTLKKAVVGHPQSAGRRARGYVVSDQLNALYTRGAEDFFVESDVYLADSH